MIVTIDEARVGYPNIKLDGMELAGMVKSYTLRHGVDEAPVLELELLPGTDLAEVKVILDNPLVNISVPAVMEGNDRRPGRTQYMIKSSGNAAFYIA